MSIGHIIAAVVGVGLGLYIFDKYISSAPGV